MGRLHSHEGAGTSREGDGLGPLVERRAQQLASRQRHKAAQENVASGRGEQRRRAKAAANRGRGPGVGMTASSGREEEDPDGEFVHFILGCNIC